MNSAAESHGLWYQAFLRWKKNRLAVFSALVLSIEVLFFLVTPWIAPYSFETMSLENTLASPSWSHWLGTDALGRDLFSRLIYGGRISLAVGCLASLISMVIGVLYGATAGFAGGRLDHWMMRIVDVLYAVPFLFLVIILMVFFGRNFILLFVALGFTQWPTMARIVRGQILSLKQKEFIDAARTIGASDLAILRWHLIPNSVGPIVVYLTLTIPTVILDEAFLSFLGLGVQAPMASWGTLISEGVQDMEIAPWLLFFPALSLSVTLFCLGFLGDGLRDALDTKGATD